MMTRLFGRCLDERDQRSFLGEDISLYEDVHFGDSRLSMFNMVHIGKNDLKKCYTYGSHQSALYQDSEADIHGVWTIDEDITTFGLSG